MPLDEFDLKELNEIEELTMTDYDIKKYPDRNSGYISADNMMSLVVDLKDEILRLKEKLLKKNKNDYPNEERDREREILEI